MVKVAHEAGAIVKVILETALLDDNQKAIACTLAKLAGADFVKTSTGFGPSGATAHDVALMRSVVGPEMGVKAAGGIRTLADLQAMTAAGATRIGASASVKIVEATALMRVTQGAPCRPPAKPRSGSANARSCSISCWRSRPPPRRRWIWIRLLANVAEIIQKVLPYDLFAILLYNEKRQDLRIRYAVGHREESGARLCLRAGRGHHRNRRGAPASRCWWATCATIRAI